MKNTLFITNDETILKELKKIGLNVISNLNKDFKGVDQICFVFNKTNDSKDFICMHKELINDGIKRVLLDKSFKEFKDFVENNDVLYISITTNTKDYKKI